MVLKEARVLGAVGGRLGCALGRFTALGAGGFLPLVEVLRCKNMALTHLAGLESAGLRGAGLVLGGRGLPVGGGARVQGRRRLRLLEVAGGRLGSVLLANELGVDKHLLEGLGGLRADQVRRRTHARLILVGVALGLRGAAAVDRERGLRLLLVLGR